MDVLSAYEVHDEQAEPYYSIWAGERNGRRRGFHILYREAQRSLRTHDLTAVARMLFSELESFELPEDRSALHFRLAVIRRNGVTALAPQTLVPFLRDAGTRAERLLELPQTTYVSLDPQTGRLLPYRRRLDVPDDAAEWLATLDPEDSGTQRDVEIPPVPDVAIVFLDAEGGYRRVPYVQGVFAMAQTAANLGLYGRAGIDGLRRLLKHVPVYALTPASVAEMLPRVVEVLDAHADAAT
jgi:hypothetical protein